MTTDPTLQTDPALAALQTTAPATLAPNVLVEVGLADRYARFDSPIGPLVVAWNGRGVSEVEAASDDEAFETAHRARTGRPAYRADRLPDRLGTSIARRLEGDRRVRIDLDLRGHTEFERDVWLKALQIPRGEVRPYGWIAREIGRPGAVRAVGSALNKNPIPLLIPCHRVVKSDGQIGEYAFGPSMKRALLASEGLDLAWIEALGRAGVRFVGDDATGEFCLPTCQWVRDKAPSELRRLPSAAAAQAAGYRPCSDCRPAAMAG
jgi:O-6-methylguanine DNA methyltransferase